jgi:ABC-2 type transport system ATP-binding protein
MTMPSLPPTVRLHGVTKSFGRARALAGVDLELGPGVTGLLGPNGAGKTTLLRALATVLRPDEGTVELLGRDVRVPEQRTEVRRELGYLPQELGFPRGFTTFQFVDYMAALKGWNDAGPRHAEVRRVLGLAQLGDVAGLKVKALSGGQRRRVGFAQALLGDPQLIVLDEPTASLDPEQRAGMRQVLADAAATATVVVSTHQTEDVAALADRVVVLDTGRVTFDGTVAALTDTAAGRVWLAEAPDERALASWRTASGRYRNVGNEPPPGAEAVEASLEDAYLLLRGSHRPSATVPA